MKRALMLLFGIVMLTAPAVGDVTISDVEVESGYPLRKVVIGYEITGKMDRPVTLAVTAKDNTTGKIYECMTLTGIDLTLGHHSIKWDAVADGAIFKSDDVVFTVCIVPPPPPLYCVVDLSGEASVAGDLVTKLSEVPSGGWTDEYKTTKLVLRRIEAGKFKMQNQYEVMLTKPFYMGVFEVTEAQWNLVMGNSYDNDYGSYPADRVTYNMIRGSSAGAGWPHSTEVDAGSFMGKIRNKTKINFDLPTEAQWEYACRAGTDSDFNNGGSTEEDLQKLGMYFHGGAVEGTKPVGTFRPNAWGLYDMHGNVEEFCLDWHGDLNAGIDPQGAESGSYRIKRGGHYICSAGKCTSFWRACAYPTDKYYGEGFRLSAPGLLGDEDSSEEGDSEVFASATSGRVSVDTAFGIFVCTQYDIKSSVTSLTTAKSYIADADQWKCTPTVRTYDVVAFSDDDSASTGFETVAFPGNTTKSDKKDNFVVVATGKVIIPDAGDWSFACGTDDGFELTLTGGGQSYTMSYESTRSYGNVVKTFNLAAGVYDLNLIYFESTGGADCLLSAAKGKYTSFDSSVFKLIGDSACNIVAAITSPDPIYTTVFNAAGGSPALSVITRQAGKTYGTLPTVKRNTYVFDGWYTAKTGGKQIAAGDKPTGDSVVYAHWLSQADLLAIGLDSSGFTWQTGGTKVYDEETVNWTQVSDADCVGGSCVRSGVVDGDGSLTWIQTTVSEPGTISFKYKFQSYSGVFTVTCDGAELLRREGPTGTQGEWTAASVNVTQEGTHQIRFSYQHEVGYGSGHNGVMLDGFEFAPSHCHVILKANNGTDDSKEILVKLNEPSALPKVMFSQFNSTFQGWAMSETGSVKYSDGATVNFSDRTVVLYAQWRAYSYAEILDVSGCEFQSGGNGNWSLDTAVSKFGGHSVRSGGVGDRQTSWMRTGVTGPTVMTFWWKVSSEADYDFLKVLVDGDEEKSISGETDWQKVSLVIQAGAHTVEWQYAKDQATVAGSDCGWVDRVEFSTAYVVTFDGNGGTASVEGKAYAPGESYGELPACARSGSRFLGWFTQADGGTEVKPTDVVSSDVTLYAHWEELSYGLLMRYYDGVGNAYTQWTQSFDSLLSYFYARTPTLTEWSETNTDTLDFGETSSGCKYHGKYAISSTDNFAMWMTGYVDLKFCGEYEFNVKSDDGFVLYVDGRLTANYTGDRGMDGSGTSGKIALTRGVHRIDLVHRDGSGDHGLCLTFKEPFGDGLVNIRQTDCPKGATIRFEAGEGVVMDGFERRYVEGLPIVDLPSPVREGYDFIGWFTREDGGVRVEASDVFDGQATLFAHWEVRADVKFDANGGACETATHHYTKGKAYGWLPSCTRTGYDFVGWYTTSGGGTRVEVGSTVAGGGTLYAHWQKQFQDLTFDTAGGCSVGTISVPYGERVGNLPIPTKEGCVFDGWYDRAVGGSRLGPDAVITAGQKLYAHWKDADEDEVWLSDKKLDICSGARQTSETQQLTMSPEWEEDGVKAIVSVDGVPYREATSAGECTWAGTRTKEYTLTHQVVDAGGAAVGEPYVAKFNWINRVTVTFECQNGEAAITKTYDEAFAYGELPVVSRTGYAFDGWYTAESGGTKVSETDIVPGAMTFYAHWINNRYSIRFHANGGEGQMEDQSFSYDNAQDLSATAFTRTGYTFAGWATSAGGQVAYGNGQSVKNLTTAANGSVDLYAIWNGNAYAIKFNANGGNGSMANEAMTYDAEKTLTLCAFTKTGYTFAGWATSAGGEVVYANGQSVKNLTVTQGAVVNLYAKWTANGYAVAFNANGGQGTMANESMTYDTAKELTACAFTRTGYTFAGWATSAGGTVKYADGATIKNLTATAGGTVTLYAKWTPNNYVIDFNPGQGGTGTMSDQPMTYDEEMALYANLFARTGYTFLGWTDDEDELEEVLYYDGVVVENLTDEVDGEFDLYAVWAANEYMVRFNANGGKGTMADQAFLYDEEQGLTSNGFTRAGCEFLGWATSAVGGVVYADGEAVSNLTSEADGIVNLYAVWDGTATTWMEDDSFSAAVANTYDGYVIDEDYNLFGIVQVKTAKQSSKGVVTATATVTDANGKKWSYSKGEVTVEGVVTGLKCTTKGCPVAKFGVTLGKNGLEGEWGPYEIFGARQVKPSAAYVKNWTVSFENGDWVQLKVDSKGAVKFAGSAKGKAYSGSTRLIIGDGFAYVPVVSGKNAAFVRIEAESNEDGVVSATVSVLSASSGEMSVGGITAKPRFDGWDASANTMVGVAYSARPVMDGLGWPLTFTASKLPTGCKINASTGVISGIPTKTGTFLTKVTATSKSNKKWTASCVVTNRIVALPEWAKGQFTGTVDGHALTMSVGSTGKVSGKFKDGITNWTFSVSSFATNSVTVGETNLVCRATAKGTYKNSKKKTVTVSAPMVFNFWALSDVSPVAAAGAGDFADGADNVEIWRVAAAKLSVNDAKGGTVKTDKSYGQAAAGAKVKLTATLKKGYTLLGWYDEVTGERLSQKTSFSLVSDGVTDRFVEARFAKEADLSAADFTLDWSGPTNLTVGVKYSTKLTVLGAAAVKIASVSGLPKGLSYKSGKVSGVATTAKTNTVSVKVVLVTNTKKTWTLKQRIVVEPLPDWACDTFTGDIGTEGEPIPVTVTVASSGKVSGKYKLSGATWTFSTSSLASRVCDEAGKPVEFSVTVTASATIKNKKKTQTLLVTVTPDGVVVSEP